MDRIKVKDLEVYAHHGVYPEENALGQKFVVSVVCDVDTRWAGRKDELEASLDYGKLSHVITRFMKENQFKLLESVAEQLAELLLWTYPVLKGIKIEIKKPWAPIGLPLDYASVEIYRKKHTAYIALGSNLGEREEFIRFGIQYMAANPSVRIVKISDFVVTPPYGGVVQEDFLNGVVQVDTTLYPQELLGLLKEAEMAAGRQKTVRWGPRTLDLDLLFYDDEIIDEDNLTVPHIGIPLRDFVLVPMVELAPNYRHPLLGLRMCELLERLKKNPEGR